MPFDPPTFFLVLFMSTLVDAVLLLWCWLQNRADRTLLFCSVGYALNSVGTSLLMSRDAIPSFLAIDLANALIIFGFAQAWNAARVFNGLRARFDIPLIGPIIWILACRKPEFYASFAARMILVALIQMTYGLLTASEIWKRDGLRSRYPIAFLLVLHAAMVGMRIPLVISDIAKQLTFAFASPSFDVMAIEALVFAEAIAFLIVCLTKERVEAHLRTAALTDPLTGLCTRRALFEYGASLMALNSRHQRPISILVFDLDRFKQINDTFGHAIGDAVIRQFSLAARTNLRLGDHIGRIGGEEFVAILPDTNEQQACVVARRLMSAFANLASCVEECQTDATVSAGIANSTSGTETLEQLLALADRALYEAKRQGPGGLAIASAIELPLPPLSQTAMESNA